jgi:hypothetical protein
VNRRRKRRHGSRSGYVLVMFVMLAFVFFAFAALVIDLGFVRLTQREMQTAVDSAALEGLRWRDDGQSLGIDPHQQASAMVANVFDDDLNPSDGDPLNFGAGPVVGFQPNPNAGMASLAAGQTIVVPNPPVYKPTRSDGTPGLELNETGIAVEGDMVAGTYGLNPSYQPDPDDTDGSHDENAGYGRRDYQPPKANAQAAPGFLVRMRRTTNPGGIDAEPGVSSGGVVRMGGDPNSAAPATLPYLFGRGSMMSRTSVQQGVTVRATAIAAAGDGIAFGGSPYNVGRAKTAGPSYAIPAASSGGTAVTIPGLAPFALLSGFWTTLNNATSTTVILNVVAAPGTSNYVLQDSQNNTWGYVLATRLDQWNHLGVPTTAIGQPVVGSSTTSALQQDSGAAGYVAVCFTDNSLGGQPNTVIGFGYLPAGQWTFTPANPPGQPQPQISITPLNQLPPHVAGENASGVIGIALPTSFTTSPQDLTTLFQLHAGQSNDGLTNPLYAPVLVDHYIGPNTP